MAAYGKNTPRSGIKGRRGKKDDTTLELQTKSTEVRPPDKHNTAAFWTREIQTAKKRLEDWHKSGNTIIERFLDDRGENEGGFRLNLFHANITTQESLMYANLPKVQVARRFLDANDDAGRLAALLTERCLNNDLQENGRERDAVLRAILQDRLLPGLGCARVRYTFHVEQIVQQVPGMPDPLTGMPGEPTEITIPKITDEQAPVDYVYWQDVLWGWARSWAELPWLAYRSFLSKEEVAERFPGFEDKLQYTQQPAGDEKDTDEVDSPHHKAEIWEIWDKAGECVYWYNDQCPELLDHKDDPLKLTGFFPSPPFLIANCTTRLYQPQPDYKINQDLYSEVDALQSRIALITSAVSVKGVYDQGSTGLQRLLMEGAENELIPVDNWAMFAEKGGLRGTVEWFPLEEVVNTLDRLRQLRDDTIRLLQQTTGMADIFSGSVNPYEGVGQSQLKAAWGSVPMQALQDQFSTFVANLLQLQAEVIFKHFEPQTVLERANAKYLPPEEQMHLQEALALLKSASGSKIRIEIKSEAIAQVDQQRVQAERAEFLNALSTFMQSMAPMVAGSPEALPYLLQMLQWVLSGFRGASEIEGVLDRAIEDAKKKAKEPKQDKEAAKEQAKLQGEMAKIQAKAQADMMTRNADLQADMASIQAQSEARLKEIMANHQAKMQEIQAETEADMALERIKMEANIASTAQGAAIETEKDRMRIQMGGPGAEAEAAGRA